MSLRIIVIDDEECIRDTIRMYLEDQGHEVLTYDQPLSCAVFQGHECKKDLPCGHVLFIDHFMMGMNGLDFMEKMKVRGCKGVMRNKYLMSGDTTAIDLKRVERLGCKLIQKPFTFGILDEIINDVMVSVDPDEQLAGLAV